MDLADINKKRIAYKMVFGSEEARIVLDDLRHFCFMDRTTYQPGDINAICFAEGRREVFLRIEEHLRLTEEALLDMATKFATEDDYE
jgi:hypothetical protein